MSVITYINNDQHGKLGIVRNASEVGNSGTERGRPIKKVNFLDPPTLGFRPLPHHMNSESLPGLWSRVQQAHPPSLSIGEIH